MQYLFVLGRDAKLAKLEVVSLLTQAKFDYKLLGDGANYLIIDLAQKVNVSVLSNRLAGTVRIAEVIFTGNHLEAFDFDSSDLYLPGKFNYVLSSLGQSTKYEEQLESEFKKFCKKYKYKAVGKNAQDGIATPANYNSWDLENGLELFVVKVGEQVCIAKSVACADPNIFQIKDNERPARKFTHGTSFRLAQMMVNILDTSIDGIVVDPFCGTGTFLIEGMSKGYDMIGIDIEQPLINASEQNINWAKKKFKLNAECELICGDSTKEKFEADGCVYEPYMGEFLKKAPGLEKAKESMKKLEQFYAQIFTNLKKNLNDGASIVCIMPYLTTYDGKKVELPGDFFKRFSFAHIDFKAKYGLNIENPIEYVTPSGSLISRKVHVLKIRERP